MIKKSLERLVASLALVSTVYFGCGTITRPEEPMPSPKASMPTKLGASDFKVYPRILVDFYEHRIPPRGIDFQAGYGALVTAPIEGNVHITGRHPDTNTSRVVMETDLGHIIMISCLSEIYVQPNDKVTPFNPIGREGKGCENATQPHTHMDVRLAPILEEFISGGTPFTDRGNNQNYIVVNPHLYSTTGNLSTSIQTGSSLITKLTEEAQNKLNTLGQKYQNTHPGWFINESKNFRIGPRTIVIAKMRQYGFLDNNKDLKREVEEYLRWYSNITNIGLVLPYPNPKLASNYVILPSDPHKKEKILADWEKLTEKRKEAQSKGNWGEWLRALEDFRKLSPLWGAANLEMNFGIAYRRLDQYERAIKHLLLADALMDYKREWGDPEINRDLYLRIYRNLARSYRNSDLPQEARFFRLKAQEYTK
mgnify:FL=1